MSTVMSFHPQLSSSVGVGDPADGGRDGPYLQRSQSILCEPTQPGATARMALRAVAATRHRLWRLGCWWRAQRAAGELQALDDAILKDIGVCRCEIPFLARAHAAARWQA
jgi:uncharacterized protein YjiS (DUF1127 family)